MNIIEGEGCLILSMMDHEEAPRNTSQLLRRDDMF